MTAETILHDLTSRGVQVWAEADRLKFDAPRGVLSDEDKSQLTERKSELLTLLTKIQHSEPATDQRSARERMVELLALHQCPDGCGKLKLQDRARDVWYCPGCRLWVVEGVIQ
jgi:hypothetical protein